MIEFLKVFTLGVIGTAILVALFAGVALLTSFLKTIPNLSLVILVLMLIGMITYIGAMLRYVFDKW